MRNKLLMLMLALLPLSAATAGEYEPFEMPGTQVVPIQDRQNDRQYELYIKLPEDYMDNPEKRYPVIYFTDAQWHIEILSASTAFILEDVILVGVSWQTDHKHEDAHFSRYRDYSMSKSENPENQAKYQFGQADKHLAFIRNDVFRFIESNYRVDHRNRTYFGYSMGGSFGAYILLAAPDSFKNYIVGSPWLQALAEREAAGEFDAREFNANVYLSNGTMEGEVQRGEFIKDVIALLDKRKDKTLSVKHEVVEGTHSSAFPLTGVRSINWLANILTEK